MKARVTGQKVICKVSVIPGGDEWRLFSPEMSFIAGGYLEELTPFILMVQVLTGMQNWTHLEGKEEVMQIWGRYDVVASWFGSIRLLHWPAGSKLAFDLETVNLFEA